MGKLIVVPTPVGNLQDMTFRAVEVLKNADLILAEDTRTSGNLLKHFDIQTKMIAHHKFNEHGDARQNARLDSRKFHYRTHLRCWHALNFRSGLFDYEKMYRKRC